MTALGVFRFTAQEGSRTIFLSCEKFIESLKAFKKVLFAKFHQAGGVQVDVLSLWHIFPVFPAAGQEL